MAARSDSEIKRFRYLLGLCSQAERERIEAAYFEDEAAFHAMLAAEADLIDAYARGELSDEERRRFETHFLTSERERNRVQFARAFAGVISGASPVETTPHATGLNIFESLQRWPLRTATVAIVIVLIGALSWTLIDRGGISNKRRELPADSAEVGKQDESSSRSAATEQARNGETAMQPDNFMQPSDKRHIRAAATQQARHLPLQTAGDRQDVEGPVLGVAGRILGDERLVRGLIFPTRPGEALINTADASLGNNFEKKRITELPLDERNVVGLLSLQPVSSISEAVVLPPRSTANNNESTIAVANSKSIKFRLGLKTTAQHPEYRADIQTAGGRPITAIHWTESLLPDRKSVETPEIGVSELPSGEYVLLLSGKEPDGSFVRVAEYYFKVIRNQ